MGEVSILSSWAPNSVVRGQLFKRTDVGFQMLPLRLVVATVFSTRFRLTPCSGSPLLDGANAPACRLSGSVPPMHRRGLPSLPRFISGPSGSVNFIGWGEGAEVRPCLLHSWLHRYNYHAETRSANPQRRIGQQGAETEQTGIGGLSIRMASLDVQRVLGGHDAVVCGGERPRGRWNGSAGEIRHGQRRTRRLCFARASSRKRALIWANSPGGMKPWLKTSGRPGRGDSPALGHSSILCSDTITQLGVSSRPRACPTRAGISMPAVSPAGGVWVIGSSTT